MNVKRPRHPRHPQPMQPIVRDTDGVARFQPNAIVAFIVDAMCGANRGGYIVTKDGARLDYNDLMAMPWHDRDRDQFNMLHGYSVSGLPSAHDRGCELHSGGLYCDCGVSVADDDGVVR